MKLVASLSTRPSTIAFLEARLTEPKGRLNSNTRTFRPCSNSSDCQESADICPQQITRQQLLLRSIVISHKTPLLCTRRERRLTASPNELDFSLRRPPPFYL